MGFGHAERALEAETAELLCSLPQIDAEQSSWLEEVVRTGSRRARGHPLRGREADGDH